MQGLPINQNRYDQAKRIQEQQRNREYNEHLAKVDNSDGLSPLFTAHFYFVCGIVAIFISMHINT
jgi:hypothetical protein